MELYRYKAMTAEGRVKRSRLDAMNPSDLESRLGRMGLDLISYRKVGGKHRGGGGRPIKRVDLINFCVHLEQLLRAGVPMLDGLSDLRDSLEHPRFRDVIAVVIESIQGGKNLSQALSEFPYVFDTTFVNLVRAGEEAGQLPHVLHQIGENLKWQDEQAAQIKMLLIYPSLVLLVVGVAVVVLMVNVVPELLKFVKSMGGTLPWHTKALIAVSNAFTNYWYVIVAIPVLAAIVIQVLLRTNPAFRRRWDAFKLDLPVIGPILKKIILTRFTSNFALMYASGITVLESIRLSSGVVGNTAVEEAVLNAGKQMAEGSGIAASFSESDLFPPLVLRMLRVGENTGSLETALANVGYFYTREVREAVERMQKVMGPGITVVLGVLLGWVMLSVLGPIYDLISKIKV
ncbi:MAG: type II secretion system F family protein [Gammaproteobacteria bacterium]